MHRPYWNMETEPLLHTPEMEKIQFEKLKKTLARMKANAPFYTRLFEQTKFEPEKLRGFDEFKEKVALFDKAALRQLVLESGGDILKAIEQIMPVSVDELDYIGTTTGTTGIPTPYPLTRYDIGELWGEVMARGAWRAGIRNEDRVLWCFALSMVIAGVPTMMGMQKLGCTMLPVGAEAKSERILMIQNLFRGTVYVGTPSLAEYLIEQAPKIVGKEAGQLGLISYSAVVSLAPVFLRSRKSSKVPMAADSSMPVQGSAVPAVTKSTRACTGSPTISATMSWWIPIPRNPSLWKTVQKEKPCSPCLQGMGGSGSGREWGISTRSSPIRAPAGKADSATR